MWKKFTIKNQLIIFMTIIIILVEIKTLFFMLKIQEKENTQNAIIEATELIQPPEAQQ